MQVIQLVRICHASRTSTELATQESITWCPCKSLLRDGHVLSWCRLGPYIPNSTHTTAERYPTSINCCQSAATATATCTATSSATDLSKPSITHVLLSIGNHILTLRSMLTGACQLLLASCYKPTAT